MLLFLEGADPGDDFPQKPTKATLFTMILYNSEDKLRDIKPLLSSIVLS